ncbi:MAG: ATP-binding protein [Janthinobacterium lividum]
MNQPPTGTVTFLFTDIEGSTRLWESSPDAMRPALARHDSLLRQSIEDNDGFVFKTVGDAFCAAFATAPDALQAALSAQQALEAEAWNLPTPLLVRMALHSGAAEERGGDYFGQPLNRVARLMSVGHGMQTLLSGATQELTRDHLPASVALRDLGQRRLKDLGRPEQVFQLLHPTLPADFPPLRSLDNPALPNNLPQQVTSFIGRDKQVEEVKGFLDKTRLLTLTGAGGSGKTRLSLQVAADLLDQYFDGVWLIELAALSDPALVLQAAAQVLEISEEAGKPIQRTLVNALKSKRLLLILDNCEHLVAACASLAADLLRSCPDVQILASSREPLSILGEQTYHVPSLSLPVPGKAQTVGALSQYEAVRLFIERALAVQPAFSITDANAPAVAQVCFHLDGIPLAIELAAARIRSLSAEEINTRLDQRFRLLIGGSRAALPRQQTLRALIDWSYNLLNDQEKAMLSHLSTFAGGWMLSAAEAVCSSKLGADGAGIEDWEVLDLLTSLVDKSLIVYAEAVSGGRYHLLETIRQYAADRLTEAGSAVTLRRRHMAWCVSLALEARPHLTGAGAKEWLSRLDDEHDNLRTALSWNLSEPDGQEARNSEDGLRLAAGLWRFWYIRGHWSEGRFHLEAALARGSEFTTARAGGLSALAILTQAQGGYGEARAYLEQALAIFRASGDRVREAGTLGNLGNITEQMGDHAMARSFLEQALALCRELGNRAGEAIHLNNLGNAAQSVGDFRASRVYYEDSLAVYQELGDPSAVAETLASLGGLSAMEGDYLTARVSLEHALDASRETGGRMEEANVLERLGMVAEAQGDYQTARSYLVRAAEAFRELQGRLGLVVTLEDFAVLLAHQGNQIGAATLFGNSESTRTEIGTPLALFLRERQEQEFTVLRSALGSEVFTASWEAGRAMTLNEAMDYALAAA